MNFTAQLHWKKSTLTLLAVVLAICAPASSHAQNGDYQSKASVVYNVAKYATWPKEKMRSGAPFVIGVMGDARVADAFNELKGGRLFLGRELIVKHIAAVQEIPSCHILFVSRSEDERLRDICSKARSGNVLTIGESDIFLGKGGVLALYHDGRMKYDVSPRNLRSSKVEVTPEFLQMAVPRATAQR